MFTFANKHSASYKVTVLVNDTSVEMEIDTGAALSVISEDTYKHFHSQGKLPPWLNKIKLHWHMIKQLTPSTSKIDCLVHK